MRRLIGVLWDDAGRYAPTHPEGVRPVEIAAYLAGRLRATLGPHGIRSFPVIRSGNVPSPWRRHRLPLPPSRRTHIDFCSILRTTSKQKCNHVAERLG